MIKVEYIDVWGFEHAIRGMRNPMNSWNKSDSYRCNYWITAPKNVNYKIGQNDLDLMRRLYQAGTEHRKYLRQIMVSMDITAPLYWWKEFDTYKVGTTANSCSTMHKIHSKPIELSDFSFEDYYIENMGIGVQDCFRCIIEDCERLRKLYHETKNERYWRTLIQLLPESYNQLRTVIMNYENVVNIIHQRSGHKLYEWNEFVNELKELPYIKEITKKSEEIV